MPVFILIGLGWFLQKIKRLSPQTVKENSFFLYWFAIPATLLRGILSADTAVLQSAPFLAAVWLPYLITLAAVWTLRRREERDRFAVLMLCSIRGNHFFAGIPIVSLAMGQRGVEAGTLILAFSLVAMQMLSVAGSQFALLGSLSRKTFKSVLIQLSKNPLFLTCLLGLLLVSAGLNRLPPWLNAALGILSDVSTGLALVGLGAGLAPHDPQKTRGTRKILEPVVSVWKIVLVKLMFLPAVTFAVFTCFGMSRDLVQAGVLLAAMPVAVNSAIIAQEMKMDSAHCATAIAVTTLLSLLTLPLLIRLLGLA